MVGKPGIIIGPLDRYPHFNQARPPPHQPLQGSTGPEAHPGRKLRCRQAPGSPEERQRVGPQANLIHARTSGLAAFTPGTQPFQTEMRAVAAPYSGPKVRSLELGARDWGWGSPEGAALGPQPQDLRANAYLRAAPPHLPQAGRSSRKRAVRPAPARTLTAREGRGPRATLRPYRLEDPGIARPGGSFTKVLL